MYIMLQFAQQKRKTRKQIESITTGRTATI